VADSLDVADPPNNVANNVLDTSLWPYWMTLAFKDLKKPDGPQEWGDVLEKWVALEMVLKFPMGRVCSVLLLLYLPTNIIKSQGPMYTITRKNRLDIVDAWIKSGHETAPAIQNLENFSSSWKAWWGSLQPPERKEQDAGVLTKVTLGVDSWVELRKGGMNGFFCIIMSLSWWLAAVKMEIQLDDLVEALKDVSWVLEQMVESSSSNEKRSRDHNEKTTQNTKKR
jgi:hypothetical protein